MKSIAFEKKKSSNSWRINDKSNRHKGRQKESIIPNFFNLRQKEKRVLMLFIHMGPIQLKLPGKFLL